MVGGRVVVVCIVAGSIAEFVREGLMALLGIQVGCCFEEQHFAPLTEVVPAAASS